MTRKEILETFIFNMEHRSGNRVTTEEVSDYVSKHLEESVPDDTMWDLVSGIFDSSKSACNLSSDELLEEYCEDFNKNNILALFQIEIIIAHRAYNCGDAIPCILYTSTVMNPDYAQSVKSLKDFMELSKYECNDDN